MRTLFILENVVETHLALRRFAWVFSQSLGLIKARKIEQETRRRRGKRRKRLILSGKYLPLLRSPRLRVSASPVRCFLLLAVP
jgi:hypothetical protein